jgi:hypothetical protein
MYHKFLESGVVPKGGAAIYPGDSALGTFFYNRGGPGDFINPTGMPHHDNISGRFEWEQEGDGGWLAAAVGDVSAPSSADADAVVHYPAAGTLRSHVLGGVFWSYNGAPSGGALQVESPSGTILFGPHAITVSGPGYIPFENNLTLPANTEALIRLKAAGGSVKGAVTVTSRRIQ